jgi:hypothetical protein
MYFDVYIEEMIQELQVKGKYSSAETFDAALKRIRQCFGYESIPFSRVDKEWVLSFRTYLEDNTLSTNSVNTYMSIARNAYNRIQTTFETECSCYPFEHSQRPSVSAGREKPDIDVLQKIRHSRLDGMEYLAFSRDLFLFSYYAGGMSFRDMAMLKKSSVKEGCLFFKRSRCGSERAVALNTPMRKIIQMYSCPGPYLFPVILDPHKDLYKQYRSGLRKYNIHLRKLADMLRLEARLNTPMSFEKMPHENLRTENQKSYDNIHHLL